MSLIDDALKRAQEAGQADPGKPGDRPWIPTPMPDAGPERRRRLLRILGMVLVFGAAASGGLLLVRRRPDQEAPERLPLVALPRPTPPAPAPAQPTALPAKSRPSVARVDDRGEGAAAPTEPPPPTPRPSRALRDGATYVGSVSLPDGGKIELGGIVWSETEPRALLNDRIAAVGAFVEGFTLVKIETGRVALEKDGLTIYLSVK